MGLPSDDPQLTFWTLEHLLACSHLEPQLLGEAFARRRIYGIGSAVRQFLEHFRDVTEERIRRDSFTSVQELELAIDSYVAYHNISRKPFLWTAIAKDIMAKVTRTKAASVAATVTGADVGAARDHAVAGAGTLAHEALVAERIAGNVTGDGPAARWVRQCLGLDTDP